MSGTLWPTKEQFPGPSHLLLTFPAFLAAEDAHVTQFWLALPLPHSSCLGHMMSGPALCILHFATMKQKNVKTKNQLVGNSETEDKIALLSNASKPMQVISFFQNTRCEEKTFCLCKPLLQPNAFQLRHWLRQLRFKSWFYLLLTMTLGKLLNVSKFSFSSVKWT